MAGAQRKNIGKAVIARHAVEKAKEKFSLLRQQIVHKKRTEEEENAMFVFDPELFESKVVPPLGYLSPQGQAILSKPADMRTKDDLDIVEEEIQEMDYFRRLPYELQRKLCGALVYQEYDRNQVILHAGQKSTFLYIIVAGVVTLFQKKVGDITGRTHLVKIQELNHGMQFGSHELLHDEPRTTGVQTKTPVQLLMLEKNDFDKHMRDMLQEDEDFVNQNLRSINTLAVFGWEDDEYANLLNCTKLGKFPPHTIILGGTADMPYYVYFISLGTCVMEEEVAFTVEPNLGYNRLRPVVEPIDPLSPSKVFHKRLEICLLGRGHYFGLGEDLTRRYVRTMEYVQVLMVPRHVLLLKQLKIFDKLKEDYENTFPSQQEILDRYLEYRNWEKFKKNLVKELLEARAVKESKTGNKPPFVRHF